MSRRDLDAARERLRAVAAAAETLAAHAADLHTLAYEQRARGLDPAGRPGGPAAGVETAGDLVARELWRRLVADTKTADDTFARLRASVLNHLSRGGPTPETFGGSLISKRDYRAALARQAERRAAGEYTPARLVDQPDYPGGGA